MKSPKRSGDSMFEYHVPGHQDCQYPVQQEECANEPPSFVDVLLLMEHSAEGKKAPHVY